MTKVDAAEILKQNLKRLGLILFISGMVCLLIGIGFYIWLGMFKGTIVLPRVLLLFFFISPLIGLFLTGISIESVFFPTKNKAYKMIINNPEQIKLIIISKTGINYKLELHTGGKSTPSIQLNKEGYTRIIDDYLKIKNPQIEISVKK